MSIFGKYKKTFVGYFVEFKSKFGKVKVKEVDAICYKDIFNFGYSEGYDDGLWNGIDEYDSLLQSHPSIVEDIEVSLSESWVAEYKHEYIVKKILELGDKDLNFNQGYLQGFVGGYYDGLLQRYYSTEVEAVVNEADKAERNFYLASDGAELTPIQFEHKIKKHKKRADLAKLQYEHYFKVSDNLDNEITRVFTIFNILILAGGTFISGSLTSRLTDTYLSQSPLLLIMALAMVLVDIVAVGWCWFLLFKCHFGDELNFIETKDDLLLDEANNELLNDGGYHALIATGYLKTAKDNANLIVNRRNDYKKATKLFRWVFIFSLTILFLFVFIIATDSVCDAISIGTNTPNTNAVMCMSDVSQYFLGNDLDAIPNLP